MKTQPEALHLADCIDPPQIFVSPEMRAAAAAELRRLHEANQAMLEALKLIAETDVIDAALDPQRAVRVAQKAITKGEQS